MRLARVSDAARRRAGPPCAVDARRRGSRARRDRNAAGLLPRVRCVRCAAGWRARRALPSLTLQDLAVDSDLVAFARPRRLQCSCQLFLVLGHLARDPEAPVGAEDPEAEA